MLTITPREAIGRAEKPVAVFRGQAARLPWAWTGLCFGVAFNESSNEGTRDIVNNISSTTQANLAWTRDSGGNTAADLPNAAYIQYPDNPQHDRPDTEITVCARLRWAGTSDAWGGIVINRISLASPYSTWALTQRQSFGGQITGQVTVGGTVVSVANLDATAAPAISTAEFSTVFLRWRSTEAITMDIFGERGQTVAAIVGASTPTGSLTYQTGEAIRINASEDPAANFSGHYSQIMVWNRKLTNTEMVWLVQDPFGWYSPRRETVGIGSPYPLIFGGGEMRGGSGMRGMY
jgi:hypothetical protein